MKHLLIERGYLPQGTFGHMTISDDNDSNIWGACATVERPWLGNKPNMSCIPEGQYLIKPRRYNRGGYDAYEVCDVQGRSAILIHVANWPHNVQGCIGVGREITIIPLNPRQDDYDLGVTSSRDTFKEFMEVMDGDEGVLVIRGITTAVHGGF